MQRVTDEAKKHFYDLADNGNNKRFKGKVAFVGHSLGSVISYDMLMRQWPLPTGINDILTQPESTVKNRVRQELKVRPPPVDRFQSRHMFEDIIQEQESTIKESEIDLPPFEFQAADD